MLLEVDGSRELLDLGPGVVQVDFPICASCRGSPEQVNVAVFPRLCDKESKASILVKVLATPSLGK